MKWYEFIPKAWLSLWLCARRRSSGTNCASQRWSAELKGSTAQQPGQFFKKKNDVWIWIHHPQSRNIKHTPKTTGLELDLFIGSLIDPYWVWESDSSLGKSMRRLLSGSRSGTVAQSLSMGSILSPAWQGEHMCQAHCAKHTQPGIDRHPTSERTCSAFVLRGGGVMKTQKGTLPPTGVYSTVRSFISPCCWGWWWFITSAHKAL